MSLPRPIEGLPLWSSDGVLWGVVRLEGCFDVGDTARHAGLVQHAYPLGRDWLAACGFKTPLREAFDGVKRPLLSMPGVHNPRCQSCAALIVPSVQPAAPTEGSAADPTGWIIRRLDPTGATAADRRSPRPAVAVPVPGDADETASAVQAGTPDEHPRPVIDRWRRAALEQPPEPDQVRVMMAAPVGRRAFMEIDRAERIWR